MYSFCERVRFKFSQMLQPITFENLIYALRYYVVRQFPRSAILPTTILAICSTYSIENKRWCVVSKQMKAETIFIFIVVRILFFHNSYHNIISNLI